MRFHGVLVLVTLVVPFAAGAGYELGGERTLESTLDATLVTVYHVPLTVIQTGSLYAKILGTPGNAAYDGSRSNGTWSVAFALVRADGAREDLGSFNDSTSTRLVNASDGDRFTLEASLHAPPNVATGGELQKVYVALAYRAPSPAGASTTSGGTLDEARALTLLLHVPSTLTTSVPAPLPAVAPPPADAKPVGPGARVVPPVSAIVISPSAADAGGTGQRAQGTAIEPPSWFAALVLSIAATILLALIAIMTILFLIWKELRVGRQPRMREIHVPIEAKSSTLGEREGDTPPERRRV